MGVEVIFYSASWLLSDPSWSPRSSKGRPRSSFNNSQTDMSKLSGTGRNPEALTTGCEGDSRARSWCPTSVMGATRKQTHAVQQLLEVPSPQHQGTWSAADVQQILLCWNYSQYLIQEPQNHCGKSTPAVHQSHQSQYQAEKRRKWIDSSWCTLCLC